MGFFAKYFGNGEKIERLMRENKEFKAAFLASQRQVFYGNTFVGSQWERGNPMNAFCDNDQIYSVINKIAETTALIPGYVYEVKPDNNTKQLKQASAKQIYNTKAILDIINLRQKALEDLPEQDWYARLFQQPNPYQNQTEFEIAGYIYFLLWGEAIGYKVRLDGGANTGRTKEIYWLPPSMVELHLSSTFPRTIDAYTFRVNGVAVLDRLDASEFIHIRKTNPQITNSGEEFRGLSPLQPFGLQRQVMGEIDKRVAAQIANGAVPGIIYDKAIEYDETNQDLLDAKRDAIVSFGRNKANSGLPYYTAGELGYIATGLKLADMDIQGMVKISFKRLCNIYKISDVLFNSDVASTESNVQEQIKQMYTNACLPLKYTFRDAYNSQILSESTDKRRFFDVDISAVSEVQDNMKDLATVISSLPVIPSGNAILALFKFEESDEPNMQVPLIKQGYDLISDLGMQEPQIIP